MECRGRLLEQLETSGTKLMMGGRIYANYTWEEPEKQKRNKIKILMIFTVVVSNRTVVVFALPIYYRCEVFKPRLASSWSIYRLEAPHSSKDAADGSLSWDIALFVFV